MIIAETTCYSRVLYLATKGPEFKRAVKKLSITKAPNFNGEGFNGYIECDVVFEIDQLDIFTRIWMGWYLLTPDKRGYYYDLALGK